MAFHGFDPKRSSEELAGYVTKAVDRDDGQSIFVGTGRSARRQMIKVAKRLPPEYAATVQGYATREEAELNGGVANYDAHRTFMIVSWAGMPLRPMGHFPADVNRQ